MQLHPRLEADCHELGSTSSAVILLHRNASVPWFILVPDTDVVALHELPAPLRLSIESQWNRIAAWVHRRFNCTRVNVAAIGNLVPQLHLHIVGRKEGDPCWPGVVWGQTLPDATWTPQQLSDIASELRACELLSQ